MSFSVSAAANETALAVVLTSGSGFPGNEELTQAIAARIPAVVVAPEPLATPADSLLLLHEGYMLTVMKVGAPCPISADDPCVQNAWYWPGAQAEVKRHKRHMLVSVSGGADAKRRAGLHGQMVAAVIGTAKDALAVHWADSDSLWPAAFVAKGIAPGALAPPVMFCVAAKLSRDADGDVSAITQGLSAFGLMEIEARSFRGDPVALNGVILDLAKYLVEAGAVIKDGDTIGPDAKMKVRVRHEDSILVAGTTVYRLYFA